MSAPLSPCIGGGSGIRTHGTLARTTVFETAPFDHSGIPPGASHGDAGATALASESKPAWQDIVRVQGEWESGVSWDVRE